MTRDAAIDEAIVEIEHELRHRLDLQERIAVVRALDRLADQVQRPEDEGSFW